MWAQECTLFKVSDILPDVSLGFVTELYVKRSSVQKPWPEPVPLFETHFCVTQVKENFVLRIVHYVFGEGFVPGT